MSLDDSGNHSGYSDEHLAYKRRAMDSKVNLQELRQLTEILGERDAALKEAHDQFKAFMDNGPQIAFIKDPEGVYTYVNQRFLDVFQRTKIDVIGRTDFDLYPKELAETLRAADKKVLDNQQLNQLVESVPSPSGEVIAWLIFKFPVPRGVKGTYLGGQGIHLASLQELQVILQNQKHGE